MMWRDMLSEHEAKKRNQREGWCNWLDGGPLEGGRGVKLKAFHLRKVDSLFCNIFDMRSEFLWPRRKESWQEVTIKVERNTLFTV